MNKVLWMGLKMVPAHYQSQKQNNSKTGKIPNLLILECEGGFFDCDP